MRVSGARCAIVGGPWRFGVPKDSGHKSGPGSRSKTHGPRSPGDSARRPVQAKEYLPTLVSKLVQCLVGSEQLHFGSGMEELPEIKFKPTWVHALRYQWSIDRVMHVPRIDSNLIFGNPSIPDPDFIRSDPTSYCTSFETYLVQY